MSKMSSSSSLQFGSDRLFVKYFDNRTGKWSLGEVTDNCSLRKLQTRWIFVKTSSVTKITFYPSFQSNKTNIKLENPHDVDKSLFVCMSRNLHEDCYCWVFYQLLLSNFGSLLTRCSYNFLNLTDELFWQRYNLVSKGWLERDTLPLGINICGDFLQDYSTIPFLSLFSLADVVLDSQQTQMFCGKL